MQARQFGDKRQPDSGALVAAAGPAADAVEPLEHPGQLVVGDADTGVVHGQRHMTVVVAKGHVDTAMNRVLDRIGQQVEDDLLPHVDVDRERRWERVDLGS